MSIDIFLMTAGVLACLSLGLMASALMVFISGYWLLNLVMNTKIRLLNARDTWQAINEWKQNHPDKAEAYLKRNRE